MAHHGLNKKKKKVHSTFLDFTKRNDYSLPIDLGGGGGSYEGGLLDEGGSSYRSVS